MEERSCDNCGNYQPFFDSFPCNTCLIFNKWAPINVEPKQEPKTPCGVVGCTKEATVHFCQECYDKKFEEVHGDKI